MLSLPSLDPAIANAAFLELRACLHWMFDSTEPDMLARSRYALASIEDLRPASAQQARLAARAVAADIHAGDAMRLAWEQRDDLKETMRCRAQANAMLRHADRAQTRLEAMQRGRCLEDSVAAMLQRMPSVRDKAALAPDPAPLPSAAPDAPPPHSIGSPPAAPPPEQASAAPEPPADASPPPETAAPPAGRSLTPAALAKAEKYAKRNRVLAMRIRRAGAMTQKAVAGFRPNAWPQDQETLDALLHGASPVLAALDSAGRQESLVA